MPLQGNYLFVVSMDVATEVEALFNEVYDNEHIPYLSAVPGVISVTRLTREPTRILLGGEVQAIETPDEPKYAAIYEITSPDVLVSAAWGEAGERGRWASEVRSHTFNRRHVLRKVL